MINPSNKAGDPFMFVTVFHTEHAFQKIARKPAGVSRTDYQPIIQKITEFDQDFIKMKYVKAKVSIL